MRCLQVVKPLYLAFAFKISRGIREGLKPLEEIAQAGGEMLLKVDAVAPNQIALFGVETGKAQPLTQAACLRSSSLI